MGVFARLAPPTVTLLLLAGSSAHASTPELTTPPSDPDAIYGGGPVNACGWPTTVSMQGSCTGTLVHPEVVIYAGHCGQGFSQVWLADDFQGTRRTVPTEFCRTYPGGGTGGGTDFAFCKLAQPVEDVPIVPPLMGCETTALQPGKEVTVVGFGQADDNLGYGPKREVVTTINQITANNEASIGGGGKDSCQGDSGGPVFIQLSEEDGGDGTWRVFGITSYGGQCGGGGFYSMMHIGMEWFEEESGIDLTPCHDGDGTWSPGPDCKNFPLDPGAGGGSWPNSCEGGALGSFSSICGPPFNAEPDADAPLVAVAAPGDQTRFDSDESGQAKVTITIDADDGEGWGIAEVRLTIDGQEVPGGVDNKAPYEFDAAFGPGQYRLGAIAVDYAENEAMAEEIRIGVDMDAEVPPEPEPETTGGSGDGSGGDVSGGLEPEGSSSGGIDDDGGTGGGTTAGQDGSDTTGCACRAEGGSGGATALLVPALFAFAGWRRRRRG